ncbi:MAG: restriction endonuclease subunit S [Marinospirillum sp.]|uniref:restriction endonuclease subunit S n=1 Tax=Marinospirillum sp. TaxID=2183934 RepID=UPI0019FF1AA2|nr:restriction endonuclease subunit S [Marinospirillum sp.]MBE0506886.1 restriction endonuclease subunit S [Marinospirillum sp.]
MDEKNALVPRLRFPEFREAGEWRKTQLGTKGIATFVKKRISLNDLRIESYVSTENLLPDFGGKKCASKLPPSGSFTCFKAGDILIANIRPYLKKVWVADCDGAASNDVIVIRPMDSVHESFLSVLLKSDVFINYVMEGAKGVKMPRGDISLMKEYTLAVPAPEEQQKIAACLSSLDALIAAQTDKIDALKAHKKGLMQQLFPREGETIPRLRFPEFREVGEWAVKMLGDLNPFVTSGSRGWAAYYADKGELFVRITNLWRGSIYLDLTDPKFVQLPQGANEGMRTQLKEHDVLVSITADIGIVGYVDASIPLPAYINQHIALVRFDRTKISGKYAAYFLASERTQKLFCASTDTGTKAGMSLIGIKRIEIMLPSLSEQQKIADCLSSLDALVVAHTEKLDALKTHKKGLMQQLFPAVEETQI